MVTGGGGCYIRYSTFVTLHSYVITVTVTVKNQCYTVTVFLDYFRPPLLWTVAYPILLTTSFRKNGGAQVLAAADNNGPRPVAGDQTGGTTFIARSSYQWAMI